MKVPARPSFIGFLGFWLALSCVAGPAILAWLLLGQADDYSINGAPVTRAAFLAVLAPLVPWFAALFVCCGVTSWAILTEKSRGRPLAVALLLLSAIGGGVMPGAPPLTVVWPAILAAGVVVGLPVWWYFYRKANVVEYYARLAAEAPATALPNEEV